MAILIYLIIIGMLFFFVASPMILKANEKNNKMQEDLADQESRRERISSLPAIRSQIEMVKNQEDRLTILLNSENLINLIERLEKISEETGNNIKIELSEGQDASKKTTQAKKDTDKKEVIIDNLPNDAYIKMNISLKGKYSNFLDFLRKLENFDYHSDVVSIKILNYQESATFSSSNPFRESSASTESVAADNNIILSTLGVIFYLEKK